MKTLWHTFHTKDKSEKLFLLAMAALLLLGLLLRARHFLAGRSLWYDEAMLAINVVRLSFGELTQQPLPYEQGAPIGFLFFLKSTVLLLGDSEYSFRLFSFLTGSASVIILAYFATKYLGKVGALFSLALFATTPFAIYYSAETKQYIGDLFAVLFVILLYLWLLNAPYSNKRMAVFSLASALLLWVSYASVFGIAAVGLSLLWHHYRQNNMRAFWRTFAGLAFAGLNALLVYWINVRPIAENAFLASFWDGAYMPFPPTLDWLVGMMTALLQKPIGLRIPTWLALTFSLVGAIWLWMRQRTFVLPILLTFGLTLIAGALQKYPLAERMLLFWVPLLFLLFGAALDALFHLLRPRGLAVFAVSLLAFSVLLSPTRESLHKFQKPLTREHIRPAMQHLSENYREGDLVYLYYFSEPAYLFYAPKYGLDEIPYILGENRQGTPDLYKSDIDALNIHGRAWFLFTHVYEVAEINEEYYITDYLKQIAEKKRNFRYPGSSVSLYLYTFP